MARSRDAQARQRVLDAAFMLTSRRATSRVTVDEIAAAAGVGKQTIYRWWPSRGDVVLDALLDGTLRVTPFPDTTDARADFRAHLRSVARLFRSPAGAVICDVVAGAQYDPEARSAFVARFWEPRRALSSARLRRAMREGHVRSDLDVDVTLDTLYGALWLRLLVGHDPITARVADAALAAVWSGIAAKS